MQKKIIALAVAAAMTAPVVAMADVSVYGKADLGFATSTNGTVRTQQVTSQVTKLGFKGNEDLGEGQQVIWQIEQQIDINNAGGTNAGHNTFAGRNSFLGLKGESWGTLMLGRHDTPYKEAARHFDVFGDQFADNRHLMGGNTTVATGAANAIGATSNGGGYMDMRPGNEIMYVSPNVSGFKVEAAYAMGAENASAANTVKGDVVSVAGMYGAGPLKAAVAYQKVKIGSTGSLSATGVLKSGDSLKAWKVGVNYAVIDPLTVSFVYEKLNSSIAAPTATFDSNELGRTDWYLAGKYSLDSSDDVKLAYTKAGKSDGHANTGASMIGVGYDHYLSKRTSLYAMYNRISNDTLASYGFNGSATTLNSSNVVTGTNPSGFMVGMKHVF